MIDTEEGLYGVCFQCSVTSHLGKKLLSPELLDSMLYKLDMQDPQKKNDFSPCQNKVGQSFRIFASWKRYSEGHRRKWLMYFAKTDGTVLQISCFTEKSDRYSRPVGWRWMPQNYRTTLGDCPGSQISLSFLEFCKLLTMHFFFT